MDLIIYTHSDYADVWPAFFGQTKKYLNDFKKYIFVNKADDRIPLDYNVILYDDTLPYTNRFYSCLTQINSEICIMHHEDMFLYDFPNLNKLKEYENIIVNENVDCIKLIKGGEQRDIVYKEHDDLKQIPLDSSWIFAIQPTIWKKNRLQELYHHGLNENIWNFEKIIQQKCREKCIMGLYSYKQAKKRGKHHWDSDYYPYIATAIVKGKWNISEYPNELKAILKEYNIDATSRGIR